MSAATRLGMRMTLAAVALVAALAAVELLLRAAGLYAEPEVPPLLVPGLDAAAEPFTIRDELLIFGIMPNSRTYPWYSIDRHGWRTPPFADRKPPGTFRVITTGDSCTFGLSTLEPLHWSSVLRRALTGLCGDVAAVEVIDAGITGYSTTQNRLQVERDLAPLQPDLLVWLVTGANDTAPIEGADDAEASAAMGSPLRALARLRVSRLLGLTRHGWRGISPRAEPGSPSARPRVDPEAVQANVAAVAARLPGRLLVGLFPPQPSFGRAAAVAAVFVLVLQTGAGLEVPVVDLRPPFEARSPLPLYIDDVHPDPLGHALIAAELLPAVLAAADLPAERREWIDAWQAALRGGLPGQATALAGPGAPPRFAELAALYREPTLDERLSRRDPALPEAMLEHDPLWGRAARALSEARLVLGVDPPAESEARRDEIERFVRPADPLLACFGGETALAGARAEPVRLARALLVFTAELGLVPVRGDVRRGEVARADSAEQAVTLLAEVVALDPAAPAPRYELALALRRAGRFDAARAEWTRLAALDASGPGAGLVELARGLLAFEDGRHDESEAALRRALETEFSLGYAHTLLGRIYLQQDRLDEAVRELALAAGMLGAEDQLPALMAKIEARRAELATR